MAAPAIGTPNERIGRLSLKSTLIAVVGVSAFLLVGLAGFNGFDALRQHSAMQHLLAANDVGQHLLASAGSRARERGATAAALNAQAPATTAQRDAVLKARGEADAAYAAALKLAAAGPAFAARNALVAAAEEAHGKLAALESQADAEMLLPRAQRSAALAQEWIPASTAMIDATAALWQAVLNATDACDPALTRFQTLQRFAWVISEFTGRERGDVVGLVASGAPMTPDRLQRLWTFRGRVEMAWASVEAQEEQLRANPPIAAALAEVRDGMFGEFQQTRQAVYAAGIAAAAYPVTADAWMDQATKAINTALHLNDALGAAQQSQAAELSASSQRKLAVSAAVLLIGLALSVVAILVVLRRVARPLSDMTATMGCLAEGNLQVEIAGTHRSDEIGAMARAVQVFKDNAIEKLRLDAQIRAEEERQRAAADAQRKLEQAAGAEVAAVVAAAAAGDLAKRIALAGKTGFFHQLGESMNGLLDAVSSAVGEVVRVMSAMAQGDLSKRIAGDYRGDFLTLKSDANATAEKLAEIVGQTVEGMASIKTSTTEIATGATDLSSRTEEQVASLEQISASIRQVSGTVQHSSENAGQASQLALAARAAAENGGTVASAAVAAMGEIEQSSQRISEIVGMIDEIAFQTNLLALNAAVEAARAGDAGRGFAVVAGEVRALAQRSSRASKDIKSLIQNSSAQVKQGVELVDKAGGALGEIVTSVKRVSDIVAEIAAATKEQAESIGEVQEAIGQIEQVTQQNAALVEETTAALGSADNQVRIVTDVISFFRADTPATATPANATAKSDGPALRRGAKVAAMPRKAPTARRVAATGTDDGWEEF